MGKKRPKSPKPPADRGPDVLWKQLDASNYAFAKISSDEVIGRVTLWRSSGSEDFYRAYIVIEKTDILLSGDSRISLRGAKTLVELEAALRGLI